MKSTSPAVVTAAYLRLVEDRATTLSGRSAIGYVVLTDPARTQVYLAIVANEGGGNWNREAVPLADIEAALAGLPAGEPFGSKVLRSAFAGRSSNNAPFLAAALVHAGLLAPAVDAKHQLMRVSDWSVWATAMLAREGEEVMFPPAAVQAPVTEPALPPPAVKPASDKPAGKGRRGKAAPPVIPEEGGDADHP